MQDDAGPVLPDGRKGHPRDHHQDASDHRKADPEDRQHGDAAQVLEERHLPLVLQGVHGGEGHGQDHRRLRALLLRQRAETGDVIHFLYSQMRLNIRGSVRTRTAQIAAPSTLPSSCSASSPSPPERPT